jgi:hypothetical protein
MKDIHFFVVVVSHADQFSGDATRAEGRKDESRCQKSKLDVLTVGKVPKIERNEKE